MGWAHALIGLGLAFLAVCGIFLFATRKSDAFVSNTQINHLKPGAFMVGKGDLK
jgi:hypothetical protein